MAICRVEDTSNERLKALIAEKGQAEGLVQFLREQTNPSAVNFDEIDADFSMGDVKIKYAYYKDSADSIAEFYRDSLGEKSVKVFEGKDSRGRQQWKVILTNPNKVTQADELAATGEEKGDAYDILTDYMKAQRRIKYNRLSKIRSNIKEKIARGEDVEKLESIETSLLESISNLEEDIREYEINRNSDSIKKTAFNQLNWVSSILNKDEVTESEINESMFILDLWDRAKEIMFGETGEAHEKLLEAFSEIKSVMSTEDYIGKLWRVTATYLSDLGQYSEPGALIKDMYTTSDVSELASNLRDLSTTGIKLINKYEALMRSTSARAELEWKNWLKEFEGTIKRIKDAGFELKDFLQYNAEGKWTGNLINELSQEFYTSRKEMRRYKNAILNKVKEKEAAGEFSTKVAKSLQAKAFQLENEWNKKNVIQVDIRYLTDSAYSSSKQSYIDGLIEHYGEKQATKMIERAFEKHDKYLKDLEHIKESFNAQFDVGELTIEQRNESINKWINRNSPTVWFNQGDPLGREEYRIYTQSSNDTYTVKAPRKLDEHGVRTKWYDANYERLSDNSEFIETYDILRNDIQEKLSWFPSYLLKDNDIHAGFLPRARLALAAKFTEDMKAFMSVMSQEFIHGITSPQGLQNRFLEIDPVTGQPYKTPPVGMLENIPAEEMSDQLDKILPMFAQMAINFKWMNSMEDTANLMHKFLEKVGTSKGRKKYTDNELANLRKTVQYHRNALLYQQTKEDEGVTKIKFFRGKTLDIKDPSKEGEIRQAFEEYKKEGFDVNEALEKVKEDYGKAVEIISEKQRYEKLEELRDALEEQYYDNIITEKEYLEKIEPLEKEANAMGRNLVVSKAMDKVLRYNQDLVLGFNIFSGINNYLFGLTSNIVWSGGNTDFSPKTMWRALGLVWKSMLGTAAGNLDKTAHLIAKYGVVHDSVEYQIDGYNETLNKLKNFPYIFLKKGDYLIKGHTFIAMALHKTVKDINGKERSLYDAYDNKGRWKVEEMGENKDWEGDPTDTSQMKEFLKFKNHSDDLIKKLHGNFDPRSPVRYKKYILGRMLGQFKFSWMIEGITQRWEARRESDLMGRDVEGRYTTYGKLGFMKSISSLARLAVGQKDVFKSENAQDRKVFEENMKRNLIEVYMYAIMLGLYFSLRAAADDDDENSKRYITMANILNRIAGDTTLYFNPLTLVHLWREPFALLRLSSRASKAFHSAKDLMFDSELTDDEMEQKWLNITNSFPYINQYNKFDMMSKRVMPLM